MSMIYRDNNQLIQCLESYREYAAYLEQENNHLLEKLHLITEREFSWAALVLTPALVFSLIFNLVQLAYSLN